MGPTSALDAARRDPLDVSTRHYFWKLRLAYSKAFELRAYQELGSLAGARVLDLGCSDGTFSAMLREIGVLPAPLVGGDYDREVLRTTASTRRDLYAALFQLDASRLPFRAEAFDLALANGVLAHVVPDATRALAEVRRVLRPGGRFVFTAPTATHADNYWSVRAAEALGLAGAAETRRRRVNRNEGYVTLLSVKGWADAAERAGLRVARVLPYSSPAIGLRRSVLGTPLLRGFGALRTIPIEPVRRGVARALRAALRSSFETHASRKIEPEEADYVMIVARRDGGAER